MKIYRALFFDERGKFLKSKKFNPLKQLIQFKDKTYNIDLKNASYIEEKNFFNTRYTYFYNISNPNPLILDKKADAILNPELYNVMIETRVTQKLNDLYKSSLSDWLTPRNILIFLIVAGILYWLITKQPF